MQSAQVEGEAGGGFVQISEADFNCPADLEVGFEPLSKGHNFELGCYRKYRRFETGWAQKWAQSLFLGCFLIGPKRSKLLILWWTR